MSGDYATILYDDSLRPIVRLTLNRPDKRNPIGPQTVSELVHALGRIADDEALRVVILTGAGEVFSAGGDLATMSGGGAVESPLPPASLRDLLLEMHALGKPIVAMVNGHALAGGLGLMVACDLVVASEEATFGTPEIRVGLWPMMITAEITRNIGRKKALELMLTGRRMDAREAERAGLINRVVPRSELEGAVMELAESLAAQSPATVALGLKSFYGTQDLEYASALKELEEGLAKALSLEDAREGLMAFLQKRAPVWKGH